MSVQNNNRKVMALFAIATLTGAFASRLLLGLWPWQMVWLLGLQFWLVSQGKEPAVRIVSDEANRFIVVVCLFFVGVGSAYLLELVRRKWWKWRSVSLPPITLILALGLLMANFSPAQAANRMAPIDCSQAAVEILARFAVSPTNAPFFSKYPSEGLTVLIPPPGHEFHQEFLATFKDSGSTATSLDEAERLLAQAGYRPNGETPQKWLKWVRPQGWRVEDGCDDSPPPPPAPAGGGEPAPWMPKQRGWFSLHLITMVPLTAIVIGIVGLILTRRRAVASSHLT